MRIESGKWVIQPSGSLFRVLLNLDNKFQLAVSVREKQIVENVELQSLLPVHKGPPHIRHQQIVFDALFKASNIEELLSQMRSKHMLQITSVS